jgi:hypothetical protein
MATQLRKVMVAHASASAPAFTQITAGTGDSP